MAPLIKVFGGEIIKHVIGAVTNKENLKKTSTKIAGAVATAATAPSLPGLVETGAFQLSDNPAIAWAQVAMFALSLIQFCWKAGDK